MSNTKETYCVEVSCSNCKTRQQQRIEKGTLVRDAICNNCGCKTLGEERITTGVGGILNPYIGQGFKTPGLGETKILC